MLSEQSFFDSIADAIADRVLARLATMPATRPKRLLTVVEAAEYLGKSKQAVYHLLNQGKIPRKRIGARVMFDLRELDQWLEQLPAK